MKPNQITGIGLGLYFNCFLCIAAFDLPKSPGYVAATGIGLTTLFYALYVRQFRVSSESLVRWLTIVGIFAGIVGISYLLNFDSYRFQLTFKAVGYVSLFAIPSAIALVSGRSSARSCLLTYCLGLTAAISLTLAVNNVNSHNGRLLGPFNNPQVRTSGLQANEVGLLGMTSVLTSLEAGWPGVLLTAPVGIYVAYRSGCRGSLIGIVIAVLTFAACREFAARSRLRSFGTVPVRGVTIAAVSLAIVGLVGAIAGPFILDKVLLISDARRGLSSGFTGRWDQWEQLIRDWSQSPVFGCGYSVVRDARLSEQQGADGGFVLVLAELGGVGLLYFLGLFAMAMRSSFRSVIETGSRHEIAFLTFLVTFFFTNIFESRIVGVGSTGLGVFFYITTLCVVHPSGQPRSVVAARSTNRMTQAPGHGGRGSVETSRVAGGGRCRTLT